MSAPRVRVREVWLGERDVALRMPFRFGIVTLTACPQAFVRVRVAREGGREAWGMAAEMLAPKWLVSVLGIEHVERNGHHYVDGMADLPSAEQKAFLAAHPDLYVESLGAVRLRIEGGRMAIGSLDCVGFASGTEPDWTAMRVIDGPG